MDEFASAVLVRMVHLALADAGIDAGPPAATGALTPLCVKRTLLRRIEQAHGLTPLIGVGSRLSAVPPDPIAVALLAAGDPTDLFSRWGRLERFVHSHHRVEVREVGESHAVAEHVSVTGAPPDRCEDALVLGVLAGLLTAIGARRMTVTLGTDAGAPQVLGDRGVTEPPAAYPTNRWRFSWTGFMRKSEALEAPHDDRGAVAAVRRLVTSDPARSWTVVAVAGLLAMSVRSLQRALQPSGGFSAVVGAVRAERAAELLIAADPSLSVVGFACGYSDQPHFTREFKRRTAMTPAAYHRAFAVRRSSA